MKQGMFPKRGPKGALNFFGWMIGVINLTKF